MAFKEYTGEVIPAQESASPALKPYDGEVKPLDGEARKPAGKGFTGHARDLGLSVLQGAIGVPEAAVGLADIPTGGAVGKALENEGGAFGFRPKQAREYLDTLKTDQTQQQKQEFEQADGVMGKTAYALQNPSMIANAVAESLPSMGAGAVIGRGIAAAAPKVAPWVAGALGEGVAGGGAAAEQMRQETEDGRLTAGQSGAAVATMATTAGFGALGGKLTQKLGVGDAETMLVQGAKASAPMAGAVEQAALKSLPRKVIEGAISEGLLEELPQSASEQILQNLALGKDWSEGVDSAVVMGTLAGVAMGGGAAGLHGAMQPKPGEQPAADPNAPAPLALPAPTYTGTPSDQMLQAEAERANEVAAAEARAAQIYQQRDDFEAARQPGADGEQPPRFAALRQAYEEQLSALQGEEVGPADVPQTAPPDGRDVLDAQAAKAQAERDAAIAASRATASPDDEILQSIGAVEPPHRAMGIDPNAGPLSASAAIAVDSGAHGQMQAAAQQAAGVAQAGTAPAAGGPLENSQQATAPASEAPAQRWASMSADERASVAGQAGLPPVIARNIPRAGWEALNPDLQGRLSAAMAPSASASSTSPNASASAGWAAFGPETGTVGVPRAQMPQIKAEHRGAMVNFMNARGVAHQEETLPASSLKPTQAEFSPEKVAKAKARDGGDRAILVSADNHILDGHHQWLAARDKGEDVRAIRLNAPIRDLVGLAHEFPSSTTSTASEAPATPASPTAAAPVKPKNLVQLVREAGGVSLDRKADVDQDARTVGVFRKGGMDLDGLAELLQQHGFMAEADVTDTTSGAERAAELLRAALAGERVLSMNDADAVMAQDAEAEYRDEIRRKAAEYGIRTTFRPFGDIERDVQARDGMLAPEDASAYDYVDGDALAESLDLLDDINLDDMPALSEEGQMRALGFTEEEINEAINRAGPAEVQGQPGQAQPRAAQEGGRAGAEEDPGEQGGLLESYSQQDLAARGEAQRLADEVRAKADKAADDKARADAERDTFTLTGSDRAADVLAAQGQGGLFEQPAPAANQEPVKNETRTSAGPAAESAHAGQNPIKKAEPATPAERWDAMTAEQRAAVLAQPGGWATAAGGLNAIGKQLAGKPWGQIPAATRATVERMMGEQIAPYFVLAPGIRNGLQARNEIPVQSLDDARDKAMEFIRQAGMTPDGFGAGIQVFDAKTGQPAARINYEGKIVPTETRDDAAARSEAASRPSLTDREKLLERFPIGARVKVLQERRAGSGKNITGRIGTVVRGHFDGWYVELDKTPREKSAPVELVLQSRTGEALEAVKEEPVAPPPVGEAPSPLEALFSDLTSDSTRKANKARRAAAKLPEAERIQYVDKNFHDLLIRLMDAGALEVNGASTLTEDNKQCL